MIKEQGSFVRECGENYGSYGNGYGHDSTRGKANAGLTLGIIGTVLGAAALWNRNGGGIGNLLGGGSGSSGVPTNVNINGVGGGGCACACACACAGGGRAGCSRKDFNNYLNI